jgi:phosphatidylinositol glycan class U
MLLQSPLLLLLFSFIMTLPPFVIPLLYTTIDILIAHALSLITFHKQQRDVLKLKDERDLKPIDPSTVAALYLLNPLTIVSCVAKSTLLFTNLSITMALLSALKQKSRPAMFWIALASYLSFYPAMLVPALILVLSKSFQPRLILAFAGWVCALFAISRIFVGSWDFIQATYGIM